MAHADVLEQIVEEYLTHEGYFVRHNIKYRPARDSHFVPRTDSVHSDIDVLAVHPLKTGPDKVWAVNCKSWQGGFDIPAVIKQILLNKKVSGRESARRYRELAIDKWTRAFISAIQASTGEKHFTHVLAATHIKGDPNAWERHQPFLDRLGQGNRLKIVTLEQMVHVIEDRITKTPAATEIGRVLQLFRAAGLRSRRTEEPVETPFIAQNTEESG
jgi:hypothetical protein